MKQDHEYLYGSQEGGPKFEAPKKEGIKVLQVERGIKERALRERFRRKRKQHIQTRRVWEQQMLEWKEHLKTETLFREGMRDWFQNIGQEYNEERIEALTAPPAPLGPPSHINPTAVGLDLDATDTDTGGGGSLLAPPPMQIRSVCMTASFRNVNPEQTPNTTALGAFGRRVPPPILPSFGAMPADDELAVIATACIRKHGNLKLRRVLNPELRKMGSPGSMSSLQGSFKISPALSAIDGRT